MEKLDLAKLKLASSSLGERLRTSGAQMGRTISSKMKEILQAPTPESKIVDEATAESMEEPNWGLNLRICAMITREEYDGAEIVRAIKRKLVPGKNSASQLLSLDLLEACTSNCEKMFSEVASEKVLEDMVKLVEDSRTVHRNRIKAMQLIRAWGDSEDLMYLPVFHQTYMYLKSRGNYATSQEENLPPFQRNMDSHLDQRSIAPPDQYPVPSAGLENEEDMTFMSYGFQSTEDSKEFLVVTRNSVDILSSILNSETEPISLEDDLTMSLVEKCKESLPVVQGIVETTSGDEVMLFDALNLHDELQQVISRHHEMTKAIDPEHLKHQTEEPTPISIANEPTMPAQRESDSRTETENVSRISSSSAPEKPSYQFDSADKSS